MPDHTGRRRQSDGPPTTENRRARRRPDRDRRARSPARATAGHDGATAPGRGATPAVSLPESVATPGRGFRTAPTTRRACSWRRTRRSGRHRPATVARCGWYWSRHPRRPNSAGSTWRTAPVRRVHRHRRHRGVGGVGDDGERRHPHQHLAVGLAQPPSRRVVTDRPVRSASPAASTTWSSTRAGLLDRRRRCRDATVRSVTLDGTGLTTKRLTGSFALTAWPWAVTVDGGRGKPVDLVNYDTDARRSVAPASRRRWSAARSGAG